MTRATAGGGMCARRHKCVPHPVHRDRREPSTSPCQSRVAFDPPPATAGGGMCARQHKRVPHPAHRDRREPSTSPCRSRDATAPPGHGRRRDVRQAAQVCAASGASRSARAEHVPVPLTQREPLPPPPPAMAGGGMCARRHKSVPSPCRLRDATAPAGRNGLRVTSSAALACTSPGRRSKPSTSPCRSRDGDVCIDACAAPVPRQPAAAAGRLRRPTRAPVPHAGRSRGPQRPCAPSAGCEPSVSPPISPPGRAFGLTRAAD